MDRKLVRILLLAICLGAGSLPVTAVQNDREPGFGLPNESPFGRLQSTIVPGQTAGPDAATSVFNVRAFGAKGNGSGDDTAAIKNALAAVERAGGGKLFFPSGIYSVSGPIDIPSATVIEGTSSAYNGVCQIRLTQPNVALFTIGGNRRSITIRDIELKANPRTVQPYKIMEGTVGILAKGTGTNSTSTIAFQNMVITGFDRGIFVDGSDTNGEWEFDHVSVDHCLIADSNYGIYFNSQNADYWKISNCWFTILPGGYGIYLRKAGFLSIDSTVGVGGVQSGPLVARSFIYATGMIATLNIVNCESEGVQYFMEMVEPSNYTYPITVSSSIITKILFTGNFIYNSFGNLYGKGSVQTEGHATDVVVNSIGDSVEDPLNSGNIPHGASAFDLRVNGRVNFWSGTFDTAFGSPTVFKNHVGVGLPAAKDAVLALGTAVDNEPQLRLGSLNGFYYDILRDRTGYLVFRGNQPGYTGYRFNGDLIPDQDGKGDVGAKGARWNTVRAINVTSGDTILSDKQTGQELYRLREDQNNIYFEDIRTGKQMMRLDRDGNLHVKGKVVENSD